jgi:C4-dicarboxylate-specific signal transduction histidine kinase
MRRSGSLAEADDKIESLREEVEHLEAHLCWLAEHRTREEDVCPSARSVIDAHGAVEALENRAAHLAGSVRALMRLVLFLLFTLLVLVGVFYFAASVMRGTQEVERERVEELERRVRDEMTTRTDEDIELYRKLRHEVEARAAGDIELFRSLDLECPGGDDG